MELEHARHTLVEAKKASDGAHDHSIHDAMCPWMNAQFTSCPHDCLHAGCFDCALKADANQKLDRAL